MKNQLATYMEFIVTNIIYYTVPRKLYAICPLYHSTYNQCVYVCAYVFPRELLVKDLPAHWLHHF